MIFQGVAPQLGVAFGVPACTPSAAFYPCLVKVNEAKEAN